jgi:hypothetical protein
VFLSYLQQYSCGVPKFVMLGRLQYLLVDFCTGSRVGWVKTGGTRRIVDGATKAYGEALNHRRNLPGMLSPDWRSRQNKKEKGADERVINANG